ncbi:glucose/galactose MFS transporter [Gluconacetobacter liquefaciens]|uniref:Glucose/galactose MFS transporter n=1 Tax=Gluconacetobacter liquefaciens TaxID=89584 RepID=A0A370G3E2_GLULI|nr:glucose/galactose MFS transporter [Gluconacetobacter liquefaciens]MBB2186606.1 glucose/galactose MFS transporter [Gluconacetobacter liquefaciens]RDI38275.1 glucose/galactose transporter [Gluconacetobacter liquefaciens]GBQ99875.1 glucose/galactose transporter [Gluconacetobacter liquefaciens NRIC 0522]GEB36666.1 glucose/galactose MFS transporter [Gluconacetobacter liquefaciens]
MTRRLSGTDGPAGDFGWAPLAIIAGLFFVIGFVTWLNGPLISFVQVAFSLDDVSAFFVPLVFYLSYFLFALPSSVIARRMGLKRGLALALLVMAVGTAFFGQCVAGRWYAGALAGLLVLGAGLALLQVTVNPYVSLLGPPPRAAQRIAIMGICNKFAGILAPVALAMLVMRDIGGVAQSARTAADPAMREAILAGFMRAIYWPYMGMAAVLVAMSAAIVLSSLPDLDAPSSREQDAAWKAHILRPHLLVGIGAMFLYIGVEVMAGDAIGTYGRGLGLPLEQTRFLTALTLAAMMLGYVAGLLAVPRLLSQERCMELSCLVGCVLTVLAWATHGYVSVVCVALLGLSNAMIMPALFPIAIRGAGASTPLASALLVMAFCGGAIMPQLYVWLKPIIGFQRMFAMLMLPSYFAILLYGRYFGRERPPIAEER